MLVPLSSERMIESASAVFVSAIARIEDGSAAIRDAVAAALGYELIWNM
jgi:hypothetical protein